MIIPTSVSMGLCKSMSPSEIFIAYLKFPSTVKSVVFEKRMIYNYDYP